MKSTSSKVRKPTRAIFGASGRNIIRHLMEHGAVSREALDKCLKTKTRNRIDEILIAVNGTLSEHQCGFLRMIFGHLEDLEAHKHVVEDEIEECFEQRRKNCERKRASRMINELQKLGYQVVQPG